MDLRRSSRLQPKPSSNNEPSSSTAPSLRQSKSARINPKPPRRVAASEEGSVEQPSPNKTEEGATANIVAISAGLVRGAILAPPAGLNSVARSYEVDMPSAYGVPRAPSYTESTIRERAPLLSRLLADRVTKVAGSSVPPPNGTSSPIANPYTVPATGNQTAGSSGDSTQNSIDQSI